MSGEKISLRQLPVGESARVTAIGGDGALRRRLMDLGLTPGTEVRCLGESPGGGPRAFGLRGTVLALRGSESELVEAEPLPLQGRVSVALAGNPNVGKSTLFNGLTGLHQHTGNWPGKTAALSTGRCHSGERE